MMATLEDRLNSLPPEKRRALSLMRFQAGCQAAKLPPGITAEEENAIMRECNSCIHRREIPGNCHIECAEPDAMMTGDPHGIRNGWFMYPLLFDPTWKTKRCINFKAKPDATVSPAISPAVSHAK